jgi:hypothetical protein
MKVTYLYQFFPVLATRIFGREKGYERGPCHMRYGGCFISLLCGYR